MVGHIYTRAVGTPRIHLRYALVPENRVVNNNNLLILGLRAF